MGTQKCNNLRLASTIFLTVVIIINLNMVSKIIPCVAGTADETKTEEIPSSPPVVLKIALGAISGTVEKSRAGRQFYQFRGIQYGIVPKRFMESVLVTSKWDGAKDATEYGPVCFQVGNGDTDCLSLNVYTPYLPKDEGDGVRKEKSKMAVMVFIHGGAFIVGSGNLYGAEYFMDEDVVIVTVNYRLNVFGFLNLGMDGAPGNQGLKDQIVALKWVQQNIGYFNGDQNRVTVFGESAGAASVSFLLLSPLSKGLLHGAISQSGAATCPWAYNPDPIKQSMILARKLNCDLPNKEDILNCLVEKDVHEISALLRNDVVPKEFVDENQMETLTAMSFIPSLEERSPSSNSSIFLHMPPLQILKERQFQDVPWIAGVNDVEGFLFQNNLKLKTLKSSEAITEEWTRMGPSALGYNDRPLKERSEISEKIRKFYFGERNNVRINVTNLCSDRMFNYCTKVAAEFYSQKSPVYLYYFEKVGGFSLMSHFMGGEKPQGPTHADEMTFQWKFVSPFLDSELSDILHGHAFYNFSREFVSMWAYFAQNGKPKNTWNSKPIEWSPVAKETSQHPKWLYLNDDASFKDESVDMQKRMQFWRENDFTQARNLIINL